MQYRVKLIAAVCISMAATWVSFRAYAGLQTTENVMIGGFPFGAFAVGQMGTARSSADPNQRLGCMVRQQVIPFALLDVICVAITSTGQVLSCASRDTRHRDIAQSINPDSRLGFGVNANGQCLYISVTNSSAHETKQP